MKIFKKQMSEKEIDKLAIARLEGILSEMLDVWQKHNVKVTEALDLCNNLQAHLNRQIIQIMSNPAQHEGDKGNKEDQQKNYDQSQPAPSGGEEGQGQGGV